MNSPSPFPSAARGEGTFFDCFIALKPVGLVRAGKECAALWGLRSHRISVFAVVRRRVNREGDRWRAVRIDEVVHCAARNMHNISGLEVYTLVVHHEITLAAHHGHAYIMVFMDVGNFPVADW